MRVFGGDLLCEANKENKNDVVPSVRLCESFVMWNVRVESDR